MGRYPASSTSGGQEQAIMANRRFPPPWSVEEKARGGGALGTAKAPLLSPPHVDTLYVPATQSRSY